MDRIHFDIGDVAGIHAACCIWINGRALTQILYDEWGDVPARSVYRHRFLPVRSVQPVRDYWLGCAARQVHAIRRGEQWYDNSTKSKLEGL